VPPVLLVAPLPPPLELESLEQLAAARKREPVTKERKRYP